jgi:hypothetical protein
MLCDKGRSPSSCSIRDVSPVNVTLSFRKALRPFQDSLSRLHNFEECLRNNSWFRAIPQHCTYRLTKQSVIYVLLFRNSLKFYARFCP